MSPSDTSGTPPPDARAPDAPPPDAPPPDARDLDLPDEVTLEAIAADVTGLPRFRVQGQSSALWYEGQQGAAGKVLIVSFDNLATVEEGWPRKPWMHWRIAKLGYSNLGVQSFRKDWFRCTDAVDLLRGLAEAGFFATFERVVLIGASMGGFAALNYAHLIPGATVLAFSAQSTMSQAIAPFERRFRYSVRRSDWEDPAFLDAKEALPGVHNAFLLYDPRVPEDAGHARRLRAPNVEQVKCAHCTHEAIRVFVLSEAFFPLLKGVVEENRITPAFWQVYRGRRHVRKWLRAFLQSLPVKTQPARSFLAAKAVTGIKEMAVANEVLAEAEAVLRARLEAAQAEDEAQSEVWPEVGPEIEPGTEAGAPPSEPAPAQMPVILQDSTQAQMGAMTMVGGDHFFLKRWVDYYGAQLGRENLYVLSHGGDPEHKTIAKGCNVIYLPQDPTRYCFNQRRWQMISLITSGFAQYYNWFLAGDVDEIVAVDPDVHHSLPDYLSRFERKAAPKVVTPFAIEMVHNPTLETAPLVDGENILTKRRIFRLNGNYAKPCITRDRVSFAPGGHFASHNKLFLDPHLYLFHLRFIDHDMTAERLATRRAQRNIQSGALADTERAKTGWDTAWDTYQALSRETPLAETISFEEFRKEMVDGWRPKNKAFWATGGARPKGVYRLPRRFSQVF